MITANPLYPKSIGKDYSGETLGESRLKVYDTASGKSTVATAKTLGESRPLISWQLLALTEPMLSNSSRPELEASDAASGMTAAATTKTLGESTVGYVADYCNILYF